MLLFRKLDMASFNSIQSGRSMVEMLGVLAIIGVLSVAGIAGYSKAMASFKRTKLIDQLSLVVANIRAAYANQPDYTGLTNTTVINMGLIEDDMKVITSNGTFSSNEIKNTYGGNVEISKGAGTTFLIKITQIPQDACARIVTTDWGYHNNMGRIYINNAGSPQLDYLSEYCKAGGSTNTITMHHN